jgi:CRP-like cAMP-binding protein
VKAEALRQEFRKDSELQSALLRFLNASFAQISQTALCNRLHNVEERLARWLLLCYDRMNGTEITLTHEMLGKMLGTRRSTVSPCGGDAATRRVAGLQPRTDHGERQKGVTTGLMHLLRHGEETV